jgi:DNA-binding transcriptional LysR family regulator
MDWALLRVFFAVAEEGGINAAARALKVNPSTVTRNVDELEQQLNVTLLTRTPQGITLTPAGEKAYQRAVTIARNAAALEMEVRDAEALAEGRVRLAAPDGVAGYFITPKVSEFLRANPKISLSVDCGLWPEHPLGGETDLTLSFTEPKHPDVVARTIAYMHYALFASREYVSLYGAPSRVDEVLKHPYVFHVAQTQQREMWGPRATAFQVLIDRRMETNSSAVVVEAVRNGAGIAAMPTAIAAVEPDLVMLDTPPLAPARLWMVHHRDGARSARVRAVKDWVRQVFDARTQPWYREEFVHPRDFALLAEAEISTPTKLKGRAARSAEI